MTYRDNLLDAIRAEVRSRKTLDPKREVVLSGLLLHPEQRAALLTDAQPSDGVTDGSRWRGMRLLTTVSNVDLGTDDTVYDGRRVPLHTAKGVRYPTSERQSEPPQRRTG